MPRRSWILVTAVTLAVVCSAPPASAQDFPRGVVIDDVKCAGEPAESYALYLPSTYTRDRPWNVLMAFHPAARGRAMVEKYQAAAEQYGYIVAGSNTSRNGPWSVSASAVRAMSADLGQRFAIDATRIYLTGMSGGARVAMQVALGSSNNIAGVIASSAGFPDSRPRASVPFALYSTAGTEDFNYIEMRQLDRKLTSPHYLAVFAGGHTLPPDAVAFDAVEWLELQAMKSQRRPRDEALVDRLLAKRQQRIAAATPVETVHLLEALVDDFKGLRDVSAEAARAKELARQPEIKKALARERAADDAEIRVLGEIFDLEAGLADDARHDRSLMQLRERLLQYAKAAAAASESPERSQARRVMRTVTSGARERAADPQYLKLIESLRASQ